MFLGLVVLTHPFAVMVIVDHVEGTRKKIAACVAQMLFEDHKDLTGRRQREEGGGGGGRRMKDEGGRGNEGGRNEGGTRVE